MGLLAAVTGWRVYAAAALASALLAGAAAWAAQGWRGEAALARANANFAKEREANALAIAAAVEAARVEERRRTAAVEKARDDAKKLADAALADAARARSERSGLLERANTLVAVAAGRDPALTIGSSPGADSVDLLAYMLDRVSFRAEKLAGIADRARLAGMTCESIYDSLNPR
ncbi:DUF2514 family protein [Achromobacter sp. UBA4530]|uniref:DUF2514 family protein n=1 Tax=Achromobacter sp. UBA4530 TaxID=1945912 RepID=UPI00257A9307|nr:DUF2514 family protein [Achromobacter sp. UBA4530]